MKNLTSNLKNTAKAISDNFPRIRALRNHEGCTFGYVLSVGDTTDNGHYKYTPLGIFYVRSTRTTFGSFPGMTISVGSLGNFHAEVNIYKRDYARYGMRHLLGGYSYFWRSILNKG